MMNNTILYQLLFGTKAEQTNAKKIQAGLKKIYETYKEILSKITQDENGGINYK